MDKSHPSVPPSQPRLTEFLEQARQDEDLEARSEARSALAVLASKFSWIIARSELRGQPGVILTPTDVSQDVAMEVVKNVDSAPWQSSSHFKNWVRRVTKHRVFDGIRKVKGRQPEEREGLSRIEGHVPPPPAILEDRERELHVIEQMKSMSEEDQLLIQWRIQEKRLSFREIAERLQIGEETARQRYASLIKRLRYQGGSTR